MSLVPLVTSRVIVYSGSGTQVRLYPFATEIECKSEVTESLKTAFFRMEKTLPDEIPVLGDKVKIYFGREGGSLEWKFDGYIEKIDEIEEGKKIFLDCSCRELPVFLDRRVTIKSKGTWKHDDLIKEIVKPLTDDGIITVNNVGTLNSKVKFESVKEESIFKVLSDLCRDAPQVDFYLDNYKDLHAYYKANAPPSTETLDQTNPNAPRIFNCEYSEDAYRVKNKLLVVGAGAIIEKDGNNDYWTEDTTNWSASMYISGTGWVALAPQQTTYTTAGFYSIAAKGSWGTRDIQAVKLILQSPTLQIDRLSLSGYFGVDLALRRQRKSLDFIEGLAVSDWAHRPFLLNIKFVDTNGNVAKFERTLNATPYRKIPEFQPIEKIATGEGAEAGILDIDENFEWGKLDRIEFKASIQWTRVGYYDDIVGYPMDKLELYLDKLRFYDLPAFYSYMIEDSKNKYGLREMKRLVDSSCVTDSDCYIKAKSKLDPYAYPEKSLKSLECEGNPDLDPGTQIYVKTDRVNGSYFIRSVTNRIRDAFEYTTELELSSSLVNPPSKIREQMQVDITSRISTLEDKVRILEKATHTYEDPSTLPMPEYSSSVELDFSNTSWNWNTIMAGTGQFVTDTLRQALGGGVEFWGNMIQALGTPYLNLFNLPNFNLITNPNFELDSDNDGKPDDWTATNAYIFDLQSSVQKEGRYSARIVVASGYEGHIKTSKKFPIEEGVPYFLKCWVRRDTDVNTVKLSLRTYDRLGNALYWREFWNSAPTANSWIEAQGTVTLGPLEVLGELHLITDNTPGNDIYAQAFFDSVMLTKKVQWSNFIGKVLSLPVHLIGSTWGTFFNWLTGGLTAVTGEGKIATQVIEAHNIKASSITTDHLQANIIYAKHITASSIDTDMLRANIIYAKHITASSIDTDHLRANIINAEKITASSITTDHLQANIITSEKLVTGEAVITETAQIADLIVTTIKIDDDAITAQKIGPRAKRTLHTEEQQLTKILASERYYLEDGLPEYRVGYMRFNESYTNNYVEGYSIIDKNYSPEIKCRAKWDISSDSRIWIGIGDGTNFQGFRDYNVFCLHDETWTVNTQTQRRLGFHDYNDGEIDVSTLKGTENQLWVEVNRVDSSGTTTLFKDGIWKSIPSTKTKLQIDLEKTTDFVFNDGDAIRVDIYFFIFSGGYWDQYKRRRFISAPLQSGFTIPAYDTVKMFVWVYNDGTDVHYYYGTTDSPSALSDNTHLEWNTKLLCYCNMAGETLISAFYPIEKFNQVEPGIVLHNRLDSNSWYYYYYVDQQEVFNDNFQWYYVTAFPDGYLRLYAPSAPSAGRYLEIYGLTIQEAWM